MPTYNRTFDLKIDDIKMIETALRTRSHALGLERQTALAEADLSKLAAIDADIRAGEDLLGRLHDQKIFYRPKKNVYVSG